LLLSDSHNSSMALRNPLNRPLRTRMSGGVAGESGRPLPLCRFMVEFNGFPQQT
jgi:hypothetical protein